LIFQRDRIARNHVAEQVLELIASAIFMIVEMEMTSLALAPA